MKTEVKPPVGILLGDFRQLHEAGCIQTMCDLEGNVVEAERKFAIWFNALRILQPNLCDGCAVFSRTCEAFLKYHSEPRRIADAKRRAGNKTVGNEKVRPRCSCGFKVRGKNHNEGSHHNHRKVS